MVNFINIYHEKAYMGVWGNIGIFKNIVLSTFLSTPYKINFAVTALCNSRCKTCNAWKLKKDPSNELKTWEIDAFFKSLPNTVTWLSLTGGEPFLRNDLSKIIHSAIKNIRSLKVITIPSNGLLKDRVLDVLKNTPDFLIFMNFSIDGPRKIHDFIRGIDGGFDKTWDTYLAVLELSKKRKNLKVGIETTVSSYNINHLDAFLTDLVKSGHNTTLTFAQEGILYSNFGMKGIISRNSIMIKRLINIVNRNLKIYDPLHFVEKKYLKNVIPYIERKSSGFRPKKCVAVASSLSIDSLGRVYPCLVWGKEIGILRDINYNIINLDKERIRAVRKMINGRECPNCWTPCEAYQSIIMDTLKLNWR